LDDGRSALDEAAADEIILSSTDLPLGNSLRATSAVFIDRVLPHPNASSRYIVATAEPLVPASTSQVYLFDSETGELMPRFEIGDEPSLYQRHYAYSPDGRYLLVVSLDFETRADGGLVWNAYLHDLESNITRTFALEADPRWPGQYLVDWSADGRWLSLLTNGYVRLVSLDTGWEQPLIVPDAVCSSAVWVN
jgi:Tol biopolymer transport system component